MQNSAVRPRCRRGAFVAAIAGLLVSACSVVALSYQFAPEFVYWRLDQALDFDAAQGADVCARLDRLQAWHRRSELAEYARFLREVQARLARPASVAGVGWVHDEVRRRYLRILDAVEADAVEVVLGLRAEQLDSLERYFARMSADFERRLVDAGPERAREELFRHTLRRLERWYGAFDDGARGRLRRLAEEIPLDRRLELEDLRRRQRELLAFLRAVSAGKPAAREEIGSRLKRSFGRWEEGRTAAYGEYAERNRAALHSFYAEAANLATPAQRARALRELQAYVDEIAALAPTGAAAR